MTTKLAEAAPLTGSAESSLQIGVPRTMVWAAVGVGAILGVAYTLSPLSIWFAAGAFALLIAATRGLPEHERRAVMIIIGLALLARIVVVVALLLMSPHDSQGALMLFGDEAYAQRRALRLRLIWGRMPGSPWDYTNAFDEYGWSAFLYLLAYVQLLFGPAPFALRLINGALFVAGGAILFRLVRRAYGLLPAMVGMSLLLFLPSLFVWSISLLKESLYFLFSAASLATSVAVVRAPSWRLRMRLAVLCAAFLVGLGLLRPGGFTLTVTAIALGVLLWAATTRVRTAIVAATAAMLLIGVAVRTPSVRDRILGNLQTSARIHGGHAFTIGHSYKVLDPAFYTEPTFHTWTLTPAQAGRYVVRAFASFITVPAPWDLESKAELAYLPEQVVWYLLVVFAPIGVIAGFRRDRLVTTMQIGYITTAATGVALTSGNVGTLIRHRALTTPYLIWFSALGIIVFVTWVSSRANSSRELACR